MHAQLDALLTAIYVLTDDFPAPARRPGGRPPTPSASRETVKRSEFAGVAGHGHCRSHSRYFWGFRLNWLCAADGTPIAFELAPANAPKREVAKEMQRVPLDGQIVIARGWPWPWSATPALREQRSPEILPGIER